MATSELHYINYDPDELWKMLQYTYLAQGGDILYPGDEKEMLMRAWQAAMIQAFAIVDNALLMDSLSYSMGDYLDVYGEKRGCYRIKAQAAEAEVQILFTATMIEQVIPEGTALTADGQMIYLTKTDIHQTGYSQTCTVKIVAEESGISGNGLLEGTAMQFCAPNAAVLRTTVTTAASGGRDRESDDSYRERIRTYSLSSVTTGPRQQYEQAARAVSTAILDAKAVQISACSVGIYLLLDPDADAEQVRAAVLTALSDDTERPLTDAVEVAVAEDLPYTLEVQCTLQKGTSSATLQEAVTEYQQWQDDTIARPFNPDRLMALLYQAGAYLVQWGAGSNFNGGDITYTTIADNQRCAGEITLTVTT